MVSTVTSHFEELIKLYSIFLCILVYSCIFLYISIIDCPPVCFYDRAEKYIACTLDPERCTVVSKNVVNVLLDSDAPACHCQYYSETDRVKIKQHSVEVPPLHGMKCELVLLQRAMIYKNKEKNTCKKWQDSARTGKKHVQVGVVHGYRLSSAGKFSAFRHMFFIVSHSFSFVPPSLRVFSLQLPGSVDHVLQSDVEVGRMDANGRIWTTSLSFLVQNA